MDDLGTALRAAGSKAMTGGIFGWKILRNRQDCKVFKRALLHATLEFRSLMIYIFILV